MKKTGTSGAILLAGMLLTGLGGCGGEAAVSYSRDVQPILQANCLSCHQQGGAGYEASGFSMASYDELMKGTNGGPMIIAGDSAASNRTGAPTRSARPISTRSVAGSTRGRRKTDGREGFPNAPRAAGQCASGVGGAWLKKVQQLT